MPIVRSPNTAAMSRAGGRPVADCSMGGRYPATGTMHRTNCGPYGQVRRYASSTK